MGCCKRYYGANNEALARPIKILIGLAPKKSKDERPENDKQLKLSTLFKKLGLS